jgi:dihydroorotase-like cyclic amidohydrolase
MNDLVRICCEQPARIFNIFPVKGILQEGADADLVLVDLDRVGRVDLGRLQTKAKACAKIYENREVVDGIRLTLVRGQPVYQEGTIIGTPGWGKWLRSQRKKEET